MSSPQQHSAPPTSGGRRQSLRYASIDDIIADIIKLRKGYVQTGDWNLPQVCWHLDVTTQRRMAPGPHAPVTPEQLARRPVFDQVVATGKLPPGLVAPPDLTPAKNLGESAIDALLQTLEKLKTFKGPYAPHRLFGQLTDAESQQQILIHSAHHLSHLVPTGN